LRFLLLFGVFAITLILYFVKPKVEEVPSPIFVNVPTTSTTKPIFGIENFTEYIPGHLPLIITIPHGGHLFPPYIPDRVNNFPGVVKSNDINTQEIGKAVVELLGTKLKGRKPHVIINHLGRSKIDVNRPLKEGAEGNETEPSLTQLAWKDYHTFVAMAIKEVEEIFGRGLLIDIHGHGHPNNYIEIGYVLSSEVLSYPAKVINGDPSIPSESSIRALYARKSGTVSFDELLRGETTSLGGKLQSLGYDT
ncbi:6208_t:CDS:2, partial [Acaulospora morrowiae]